MQISKTKKAITILSLIVLLIANTQISDEKRYAIAITVQENSSENSTENATTHIYNDIEFFVKDIPDSEGDGFEPHILAGAGVDGKEWYYADSPTGLSSGKTGNLWISKDYGQTWEFVNRPLNNFGGSGDSYSAVEKDGTIYFTDLYLITITVDVSTDGGSTWNYNKIASIYYTPDDRQWLMTGPTVNGLPLSSPETVYLIYNQIPLGLIIEKTHFDPIQGIIWVPGNAGLPVSTTTGARDYLAVDQNDGTVYLPNTEGPGNLAVYVSSDGANSFTRYQVQNATQELQNIFVVIDTDRAGNVYLAWSNQTDIFLSVSQDKAQNWKTIQVTNTPGTRVLPWITAGDKGRVAITYYETNETDTNSDTAEGNWSVNTAITIDALNDTPTFYMTKVVPYVHTGSIRTTGASGNADRDLGDYLTNDVDSKGRIIMVFGNDGDDGVGAYNSKVMFARQMEGPFLLENVGPVANFTHKINGLNVSVDASGSKDLANTPIKEYLWDWGDGTNSSGETSAHDYSAYGEYNITLKVVNADNMTAKTKTDIKLVKKEEKPNYFWAYVGVGLLVVGSVFVYYLWRRNKMKMKV